MEYADYHIIYVDNRMSQNLDGKLIQKSSTISRLGASQSDAEPSDDKSTEYLSSILGEIEEVRSNLRNLLSVFNGGMFTLPQCIRVLYALAVPHFRLPLSRK